MIKKLLTLFILLLPVVCSAQQAAIGDSWAAVEKNKKGTITALYFEVKPFVYVDQNGNLTGIEYDVLNNFKDFVKKKYGYTITINWEKASTFESLYNYLRDQKPVGVFGVSSFSITPERLKDVKFTPPYLPDISVLISSNNIPVVSNELEFKKFFKNLKAVSLKFSTYAADLDSLKKNYLPDMEISYLANDSDIINEISSHDNLFGYTDLPTYIKALEEGIIVKRQFLFQMKRTGFSFPSATNNDWDEPLNAYFKSEETKKYTEGLLKKYLGNELSNLVWVVARPDSISLEREIALLSIEKEIQSRELISSALEVQRQTTLRNSFFIGFLFILLLSIFIYNGYSIKQKSNKLLSLKNTKINAQKEYIRQKNGELAQKNKELQDLNLEKNHFISIVAHDLKSPLNQIKGLLHIFNNDSTNLSAEQVQIVGMIDNSVERLRNMISKILAQDQLDSKNLNLKMEKLDLTELLNKVLSDFKINADYKNITIYQANKSKMGYVEGDKNYCTQIFENLVSNALKFSAFNKRVYVAIYDRENNIRVEVKDEGPGLNEQDKKNLFKKYSQLSAKPTNNESSTGLGLSIVKRYVEAMNGRIWCESEPGQGATFIIEFPASLG